MNQNVSQVLKTLCLRDPALIKRNGEINHNEAARQIGMNQSTFTRILNGEALNPKPETILALCRYFGVSPAQMRGEEPLPGNERLEVNESGAEYVTGQTDLIKALSDLTPEERRGVWAYIDALKARRGDRGAK